MDRTWLRGGSQGLPPLARILPGRASLAGLGLVAAAGLLAFTLMIGLFTSVQTREQHAYLRVDHALEVIAGANEIGAGLESATAEGRAYLLAGEAASRLRLEAAARQTLAAVAGLRLLTAGDTGQQDTIAALSELIARRLDVLRQAVALKDRGDQAALTALIHSDRGRIVMDRAMAMLADITVVERAQLAADNARAARIARLLLLAGSLCGAVAAASAVAVASLLVAARRGRRLLATLQHEVRDRTAELATSEARFRAYFEMSPDGLTVLEPTPDGDFVNRRINPAAERILCRSSHQLVGRTLRQVWPPEVAALIIANLRRAIETGAPVAYASRRELGGEERCLDVQAAPLPADAHGVALVLVAIRDVTEQTATEERLHQSQKVEALGRLAAGMAHDFNNLLQSIGGSLELIREHIPARGEARQLLRLATEATRRGGSLTHQLLSYVRKQTLLPRLVDLASLLEDMDEVLSRTLGPHIAVTRRVAAGLPRVSVDGEQLQTAILNLAVNAAHAMPSGGALILEATERPLYPGAPGRQVVLAVIDTGVGIDRRTLPRVFEPFFTTKGEYGTGLGLSTVQAFAQRCGGDVRIDSTPGVGTRVEIWLPPAEVASAEEPEPEPALAASGGRVLLVDDMPDVLLTVGAFLERGGFEVVRCDGAEGAEAALADRGRRFDAVVTDYAMPGMNGVELIRACRERQPGLPAVLITGLALGSELGDLPPETLVLRKPFAQSKLLAVLNIVLEPSEAAVGAVAAV